MNDHAYPPNLADQIFEDLSLTELAVERAKAFGVVGLNQLTDVQFRRLLLPPREALSKIFGAVFFASLTEEEGNFCRVSVLCTIGGCSALKEKREHWEVIPLAPSPLTAARLAKLAPLSGVSNSFLVLSCSGRDEVSIDGVAIPVGSSWFRSGDQYLRISTPHPGSLAVSSGATRLFRYSAGTVSRDPPALGVGNREVPALATISRRVYGRDDRTYYIAELFNRIAEELRRIGYGGIIAILESDQIPADFSSEVRHVLPEPIQLGPALSRVEADEAGAETLTHFRLALVEDEEPEWNAVRTDDLRVEARHQLLTAQVDRWISLNLIATPERYDQCFVQVVGLPHFSIEHCCRLLLSEDDRAEFRMENSVGLDLSLLPGEPGTADTWTQPLYATGVGHINDLEPFRESPVYVLGRFVASKSGEPSSSYLTAISRFDRAGLGKRVGAFEPIVDRIVRRGPAK